MRSSTRLTGSPSAASAAPMRTPRRPGRTVQGVVCLAFSREERRGLARAAKTSLLAQEEAQLASLGHSELLQRFDMLGKSTLGFHGEQALRRLLALRLHRAKSQATRFPLRFTRATHNNTTGKTYITLPVDVEGVGLRNFILDTGTTGILVSAALRDEMGMSPMAGRTGRGLNHNGLTLRQKIKMPALRLGPHDLGSRDVYVTNFSVDDDAIGGVFGVRFLSSFDVEISPSGPSRSGYIAFHPVGHVHTGVISTAGCTPLGCAATRPLGGLAELRVSLNGAPSITGILDLGANFSTLNTHAAELAQEYAGRGPGRRMATGRVASSTGKLYPVVKEGLDVAILSPSDGGRSFRPDPPSPMLVRDLPALDMLGLAAQPAMVVGRDLIARSRVVMSLSRGLVWVQPQGAGSQPHQERQRLLGGA